MRFRGTGTHPQYPENTVVDLDPNDASGVTLVTEGAIEPLPLAEDPGRTPSQIAASAQRGEFGLGSVADPVDRALAFQQEVLDPLGRPTPKAFTEVHGDGLVQGEQPTSVNMLSDQRGVDPQQVAELAANVQQERADLQREVAEKLDEATLNMAGPPPDEALAAQAAGEEANPQASTEGDGQKAPGADEQSSDPGTPGPGEGDSTSGEEQTVAPSGRRRSTSK